jgi:hypothetical protein
VDLDGGIAEHEYFCCIHTCSICHLENPLLVVYNLHELWLLYLSSHIDEYKIFYLCDLLLRYCNLSNNILSSDPPLPGSSSGSTKLHSISTFENGLLHLR